MRRWRQDGSKRLTRLERGVVLGSRDRHNDGHGEQRKRSSSSSEEGHERRRTTNVLCRRPSPNASSAAGLGPSMKGCECRWTGFRPRVLECPKRAQKQFEIALSPSRAVATRSQLYTHELSAIEAARTSHTVTIIAHASTSIAVPAPVPSGAARIVTSSETTNFLTSARETRG